MLQVEKRGQPQPEASMIAAAYAMAGDKDNAFEWLNRAYEQREGGEHHASEIRSLLQKFAWGSQIYGTVAATRNSRIARNQRQRLSLARAVARKLSILLLLDEATSHLDVATEARIEENLRQSSCTRITIAHRLSTVRDADRILVLEGGSIVEMGSHEELLSQCRYYKDIMSSRTERIMAAD